MDVTTVVQGSDMVPESQVGISAIAVALRETQSALIVRRVSKDNQDPYLAALMVPKTDNGTLILHRLPCLDDSRNYWFHSLPEMEKKPIYAEGVEALSSFVDALTVPRVSGRQLTPPSISYYRLFANITSKMLHTPSHDVIVAKDSLHTALAELLQPRPRPRPCGGDVDSSSGHSSSASASQSYSQELASKLADLSEIADTVSAAFPLTKVENRPSKPEKVHFSDLQMDAESLRIPLTLTKNPDN